MKSEDGQAMFKKLMGQVMSQMNGDKETNEGGITGEDAGSKMMEMMGSFTVIRMLNLLGAVKVNMTKEEMLDLNVQLNQIKRVD